MLNPGKSESQERGPKEDTRHHLPDNLGLTQALGEGADKPARQQDAEHLQEKQRRQLWAGHHVIV
jgi:hypothetical protein